MARRLIFLKNIYICIHRDSPLSYPKRKTAGTGRGSREGVSGFQVAPFCCQPACRVCTYTLKPAQTNCMRILKAIMLVVLVLYNWVQGCLFCFEYTHRWELRHEMNQEEAALAARLQAQLLLQSAVHIVDQTYKGRLGVIDPYDFAFANAAAAGDTTWYVVHSQLPEASRQTVRIKDGSDPSAPLPPVSFQDFFSPYLPDQLASLPVGRAGQSGCSSLYPAPQQLSSRLLVADTPPPEV